MSSSNCLLYGTLITLADGRRVPIEMLRLGDDVRSLVMLAARQMSVKVQPAWQ